LPDPRTETNYRRAFLQSMLELKGNNEAPIFRR
jgi:hypothetical protein